MITYQEIVRQSRKLQVTCASCLKEELFQPESEEIRPFLLDGEEGLLKKFILIIAYDGEKPVAIAKMEYKERLSSVNYIHVFVKPEYRGQKIGEKCVLSLKETANRLHTQAWGHSFCASTTEFFSKYKLLRGQC